MSSFPAAYSSFAIIIIHGISAISTATNYDGRNRLTSIAIMQEKEVKFTKINHPNIMDVKKGQDKVGTEEYLGRINH